MKTLVLTCSMFVFALMGIFACKTIPQGVPHVQPFIIENYLGKWYEVARFDFSFEKHLDNTTATYSFNPNGSIKVVNRGYHTVDNKWKEVTGKAKFVKEDDRAMLKVSFFGPFYGGYNLITIDADYKYALVCGSSLNYLWILSREKTIPDKVKLEYVDLARRLGFEVDKLLWVKHDQ